MIGASSVGARVILPVVTCVEDWNTGFSNPRTLTPRCEERTSWLQ